MTIATLGNAVDFGNLTGSREYSTGNDDSVRGLWGGGYTPTVLNTIEYIQIATTGDAIDFGDLTNTIRTHMGGISSGHGGL